MTREKSRVLDVTAKIIRIEKIGPMIQPKAVVGSGSGHEAAQPKRESDGAHDEPKEAQYRREECPARDG